VRTSDFQTFTIPFTVTVVMTQKQVRLEV